MDVDYLCFSFHTMLAPFGVGVLYAKESLLRDSLPFLYGGDMIAEGQVAPDSLQPAAVEVRRRYPQHPRGDRVRAGAAADRRSGHWYTVFRRGRPASPRRDCRDDDAGRAAHPRADCPVARGGSSRSTGLPYTDRSTRFGVRRWSRSPSQASVRSLWRKAAVRGADQVDSADAERSENLAQPRGPLRAAGDVAGLDGGARLADRVEGDHRARGGEPIDVRVLHQRRTARAGQ
jgi:hypothetical protein